MAHCLRAADEDHALDRPERDEIGNRCTGRIAILLREAIDSNPKLGQQIKSDPELAPILARPELQSLIGSLVNLGPGRVH